MKPLSSFNIHRPEEKNVFMGRTLLPSNLVTQKINKCEWVLVEIAHPSNKAHVPLHTACPSK
jgi:hypothetical protein